MSEYKVNKKHKDSLFRLVFSESEGSKNRLLELYNALNNTNYDNTDDLTITTLSDVIYMKMKNDISFLIDNRMTLFEHQSIYNPNMPLRGFLYFASLYHAFVADYPDLNMYGSKLIKIPTPQYIVFYNGTDKKIKGERTKLRLSDAFEQENKTGDFEWTATLIDINYGANKELMDKCETLKHYSIFIYKVRLYNEEYKDLTRAIDRAVDECISEGVLVEFLTKMKSEVRNVLLEEFDEERAIKSWNYTVNKLQVENEQFRNEIEQYQNENKQFRNEIEQYQNENKQFRNEIEEYHNEIEQYQLDLQKNVLNTVTLLRKLGQTEDFIKQTLTNEYNIPQNQLSFYLKQ